MSTQDNTLEVWLDDDLGPARQVGTLAHDRGRSASITNVIGCTTLAPSRWTPISPWTNTPSFPSPRRCSPDAH